MASFLTNIRNKLSDLSRARAPLLTNCLKPLKPSDSVWKIIGKDWVWCTN